ncbi:MAG TPA: ThiF family adenylyltransferase [Fimbriimonadaceae bacterium]|nr:ThiF family adenylyltransferase [Fimbriimonadaceae bacterium]
MARFRLTSDPIESAPSAAQDAAGGYVVFEGRVRDHNEGRGVRSLEYEAFGELAVKTGEEILAEALARFPILGARCAHRIGHLQIGDIAIRVEVASAHRKAAFEACDWIVDEVKRRVPIWKKEHYAEGDSGWVNCEVQPDEMRYYARQTILREIGAEGQAKLGKARVLVVGAGGLGSPALLYLAAAGIGTLGIAEFDRLDISNLHRQVLYAAAEVGRSKAEVAANRLRALNPHIEVATYRERIGQANAPALVEAYDLVLDCTDNFATKFLLNDACVRAGKPLVQASIYQYEGQLLFVEPGRPCLRCLWPEVPAAGCVGSCAEVGVLGVVPGLFGALQATEAIKFFLDLPSPLREGKMLLLDLLSYRQQMVDLARDPNCPICGAGTLTEAPPYNVEVVDIETSAYCVVDIREPDEVEIEPFAADCLLPTSRFDPSSLPEAERYLLVCESGARSEAIAAAMWQAGDRRFFSLVGGASVLRAP